MFWNKRRGLTKKRAAFVFKFFRFFAQLVFRRFEEVGQAGEAEELFRVAVEEFLAKGARRFFDVALAKAAFLTFHRRLSDEVSRHTLGFKFVRVNDLHLTQHRVLHFDRRIEAVAFKLVLETNVFDQRFVGVREKEFHIRGT